MSAATISRRLHLTDAYGLNLVGFLLCFTAGIAIVCVALFAAVTYGGRSYGRATCARWAEQTGIRTKFAILNWADSGTCLARTPDGRWVLNSKWQAFVQAGK